MHLLAALIISAGGLAAQPVALPVAAFAAADATQATRAAFELLAMTPPRANRPPVADAGSDITVAEGEGVQLQGAASFDPDGDAISFLWVQLAGAPVALEPDATVANPAFEAPRADARPLVFELRVSDAQGHRAVDRVVLTVLRAGEAAPEGRRAVSGEVSLARR